MRIAIAVLSILAAGCAADRFAVAHVWGGTRGQIAERWYIEDPAIAQLAPDGRFAVLVGGSYEAVLVAAPSGARVAEISTRASNDSVAFSADGRRFAVVDFERKCVAVWSVEPAREVSCVPAGDNALYVRIALSPDGGALAILDTDDRLSRWSVASPHDAWSVAIRPGTHLSSVLAWPATDVIIVTGYGGAGIGGIAARDAATGAVRWALDRDATYLGVVGGDAVMSGEFLADGPGSGPIARIELATGKVRDLSGGGVESPWVYGGAALADGTAIVIDSNDIAHRVRLGGGEVGSYVLPEGSRVISAQRDGRFALVLASQGIVPWDLTGGALVAVDGQHARILALDADERGVIAIAEDGSVVERDHDGNLRWRGHMRTPRCRAAAVSATARLAACAAELHGRSGQFDALETHEWLALDGGSRGDIGLYSAYAIAIDRAGSMWTSNGRSATWLDARNGRSAEPDLEITGNTGVRVARIVSGGEAVVYGGMISAGGCGPAGDPCGRWTGEGLALMTRDGRVTVLDPRIPVIALGSDRAGDRLVVASYREVQLWRRTGAAVAWARQWSTPVEDQRPLVPFGAPSGIPSVAVSEDGARVAVAEPGGRTVALYDGATGARIASVAVGGPEGRTVSALAFGGNRLYAGTSTGLVLVLSLPRR
ncbi:MAG: WD40 repeat domain-containing protein [Kofleriaceae bacterium]|nr:WD40 repeat domain-containing protein [Kofleriaceae bacterium]